MGTILDALIDAVDGDLDAAMDALVAGQAADPLCGYCNATGRLQGCSDDAPADGDRCNCVQDMIDDVKRRLAVAS